MLIISIKYKLLHHINHFKLLIYKYLYILKILSFTILSKLVKNHT